MNLRNVAPAEGCMIPTPRLNNHAPLAIDSTKLHLRFCTSGLVEDLGVGAVGRSGADGDVITGNVLRYSTMREDKERSGSFLTFRQLHDLHLR